MQVDEAYTADEVEHFISRYPRAMQWSQRTNFNIVDHLLVNSESLEVAIQKLRLIKSPAEVCTRVHCSCFDVQQSSLHIFCGRMVRMPQFLANFLENRC